MIKAIIFDCFGVVRTDPFDEAYRAMGGDPDNDRQFIRDTVYASNSGRIPTAIPYIAARLGISEQKWLAAIKSHGEVNMELLTYIQELRKTYKIGMLTNVSKNGLLRFFEPGFLEQYFDDIIVSGEVGFAKPEAEAYEIAAARLGQRLDACVFTDDREEYIEGAQAVGMQAILYRNFEDFKSRLHAIIRNDS